MFFILSYFFKKTRAVDRILPQPIRTEVNPLPGLMPAERRMASARPPSSDVTPSVVRPFAMGKTQMLRGVGGLFHGLVRRQLFHSFGSQFRFVRKKFPVRLADLQKQLN